MMQKLILLFIVFSVIACKNDSNNATRKQDSIQSKTISKSNDAKPNDKVQRNSDIKPSKDELLKKEATRLRAGGSVKKVQLIDRKAIIEYVQDYEDYKKLNPNSRVTKKSLEDYWSTGKAIKKALNDGSVRLMRKLDFVDETEIILPHKGKVYTINVSKSKLEVFLDKSFEEVKQDWSGSFSDEYVYSDSGRNKFFKKFGKVK